MDDEQSKKILQISKEMPDDEYKFDIGEPQEIPVVNSNIVEVSDKLPNTPQVNIGYIDSLGANAYTTPNIHPNAIKKLAESNPVLKLIGRMNMYSETNRGQSPIQLRCIIDESDLVSKGNFYRLFPFKDNSIVYTVKGEVFVINNYPYILLRLERDQWKETMKFKKHNNKRKKKGDKEKPIEEKKEKTNDIEKEEKEGKWL